MTGVVKKNGMFKDERAVGRSASATLSLGKFPAISEARESSQVVFSIMSVASFTQKIAATINETVVAINPVNSLKNPLISPIMPYISNIAPITRSRPNVKPAIVNNPRFIFSSILFYSRNGIS